MKTNKQTKIEAELKKVEEMYFYNLNTSFTTTTLMTRLTNERNTLLTQLRNIKLKEMGL